MGKYCQRQKCQGQRVGRKGAAKRAALSREQSVSQQSGFYIYIYITEYSDALKTTTEEASSLQPCVCFINQAARSHYFLT